MFYSFGGFILKSSNYKIKKSKNQKIKKSKNQKIKKMKKIGTHSYKEIALANLKRFRYLAMTNKFAKGKKYKMIEEKKINRLGFTITEYIIIEL